MPDLSNLSFNVKPADPDPYLRCEACAATTDLYFCDSDWGPLTVALCATCAVASDYDPND